MIRKVFDLLEPLPLAYLWKLEFVVSDAEGGYGWHREPIVSIYMVGEKCRKCGCSTIDGTDGSECRTPFSRHKWKHDEVCIFYANVFREFEKFESFISELMRLHENRKLFRPTRKEKEIEL